MARSARIVVRVLTMDEWPPPNLVHVVLAQLDPALLTSPDGKRIQVSLDAICKLLREPPIMLMRPTNA